MKKAASVILLFCIVLTVCSFAAIAENENAVFQFEVIGGTFSNNSEVKVRFSLTNISAENGASMVEAHISFPDDQLELVSVQANHPAGWDFDKQIAEDWTSAKENNSIYFVVMNTVPASAVKEDGVLYVDAVFRVLDDNAAFMFKIYDSYYTSFKDGHLSKINIRDNAYIYQNDERPGTSSDSFTESSENVEISDVSEPENKFKNESWHVASSLPESDVLHDVTVNEEKPLNPDTLIKILVAVGGTVVVITGGLVIYTVRKKRSNG